MIDAVLPFGKWLEREGERRIVRRMRRGEDEDERVEKNGEEEEGGGEGEEKGGEREG